MCLMSAKGPTKAPTLAVRKGPRSGTLRGPCEAVSPVSTSQASELDRLAQALLSVCAERLRQVA